MNDHQHTPAKIRNFSLAFQQMCSFVAIGQTKDQDETLRELILQIMVLFPDENIINEHDLGELINSIFGLQIADHEIKFAINRLLSEKALALSDMGTYQLNRRIAKRLKTEIDKAIKLEEQVRGAWENELLIDFPELPFIDTWNALRIYLADAFLRHGIQAVALLDSSIDLDQFQSKSLTELINNAVTNLPENFRLEGKRAISDFVAKAGKFPERSVYIAQLADGAFNYFSLATDPNTANRLRDNLSPLLLFLDTNFLFGVLGLDSNPQVAVSNELIKTIQRYDFPFDLKRHKRTEDELINTVNYYEEEFLQRRWSKSISSAAVKSRLLSGVEVKYHQAFVETGVDVQSFFRPYHHADILLNQKSIDLFDEFASDENTQVRNATLIADYEDFLKKKAKFKSYKTINHDMTVLDVVRQLRSKATSTLDAGALLITCDYNLYRFDWETSKKQGIQPCTVLPNLFWQILRPYIPSDENFSQAFAQTFAIPEFRTISSGAADACSKMVSIMAGYNNFPEETAERMLSNDVLIDKLRRAHDDEEFQRFIETEIVEENAQLLGENIALTQKFEVERTEKSRMSDSLEKANELIEQKEIILTKEQEKRVLAEQEMKDEKERREVAEQKASKENEERRKIEEKYKLFVMIGRAIIVGLILIGIFEIAIYSLQWVWLINHKESYGLQGCIDILMMTISFLVFVPKYRKYKWFPVLLSIFLIILQLAGGPK